jgi:beta-mannosidase
MKVQKLTGRWELLQQGHTARFAARVPGTVHWDLLRHRRIPDPFYRDNEAQVQWVGEADWVYERRFSVSQQLLQRSRVLLRCWGLDTLAAIHINQQPVGRTDNMFRTWEFDVRGVLRPGPNTLRIDFAAPFAYLAQQDRVQPRTYGCSVPAQRLHHGAWLRKSPCSFGWDWGPKLATAGIWRDIELVAFDHARFAQVAIRQHHRAAAVTLTVNATLDQVDAAPCRVEATLRDRRKVVARASVRVRDGRAQLALRIQRPALWWPNGLGEQPLYELCVQLRDQSGHTLDAVTKRVGLRTLRLRRRPDRWGESFEFVVNGVPFFAKGANWIPADSFPPRVNHSDYQRLLGDARDANMNMLRVWGGGIYEADAFYQLCDQYGLCVWQDFMFACGTYPSFDAGFMRNVEAEAIDNVRRLRHHACLALFWNPTPGGQATKGSRSGEASAVKVSSSKDAALAKAATNAKAQPADGDAPSKGPTELAPGTPPDSPAPAASIAPAAEEPAAANTLAAEEPAAAAPPASERGGSATTNSPDPESTDQRDALNAAFEGNLLVAASRYDQLAKSSGAPVFSLAARLTRDQAVRKP